MKRKFRAGLIILAAAVVLFSGCTIVVTSSETWNLYYTWQGSSEGSAVWTLYSNGTFEDSYGGSGYWSVQGSLFQLQYNSSSFFYTGTTYTGTVYSSSYMAGNMSGQDIYGATHNGTWYAYLGAKGSKGLSSSSDLPNRAPSGEPIKGD